MYFLNSFCNDIKVCLKGLPGGLISGDVGVEQFDEFAQLRQALPAIPEDQVMNQGPRLGIEHPALASFIVFG